MTLPHPPADRAGTGPGSRPCCSAEAHAFEDLIAAAPEQWWAVFFPIWEAVGPRPRGAVAASCATPSPEPPAPTTRESTP